MPIMNNINKSLVFFGSLALLMLSMYLFVLTGHTRNSATNTNTVSFFGQGKIVAKPDVAVTSFSIVTEGATSKEAQDKNSAKSKTVTDFLKKQNIEDKDIKTTSYNIYPTYVYSQILGQKITGYQVTQTIEVKVREIDKANSVLDGIVSAGVNQVNQLSFQIDEPEKLKAEARQLAIKDAEKKAKDLGKQLDISIGKLINFSEDINGGGGPITLYERAAGLGGGGDSAPSTPVGENEIIINVTLTYQLR